MPSDEPYQEPEGETVAEATEGEQKAPANKNGPSGRFVEMRSKAAAAAGRAASMANDSANRAASMAKDMQKTIAEKAQIDKSKLWSGIRTPFIPFLAILFLFGVMRLVFGFILSGEEYQAPKETKGLMEVDRAFGWMLGPLAAIAAGLGGSFLANKKARVWFVVIGSAFAIALLVGQSFVTQYLSTFETDDLAAAGKRSKNLKKMRAIEFGAIAVFCASMAVVWLFRTEHAD
jgi:hypothetical protein